MSAILSTYLLKKNKVTKKQQDRLQELYEELDNIIANSEKSTDKKSIPEKIRKIEFKLQDNWNFARDATKHSYEFALKGCTCPVNDNEELFGFHKYYNSNCPYHGIDYMPMVLNNGKDSTIFSSNTKSIEIELREPDQHVVIKLKNGDSLIIDNETLLNKREKE